MGEKPELRVGERFSLLELPLCCQFADPGVQLDAVQVPRDGCLIERSVKQSEQRTCERDFLGTAIQ